MATPMAPTDIIIDPPCAAPAARHPPKGAMPVAWQSQFHGILG